VLISSLNYQNNVNVSPNDKNILHKIITKKLKNILTI
jgi:hypothetical protein